MREAADLIEFQQQGLEALTKMDEGLKKRGGTLKEFLRRGDEVVQGHRDPTGARGQDRACRARCAGQRRLLERRRGILTPGADCGRQDEEG